MGFWETCFQRTYHAFMHSYHGGRDNVLWWLDEADNRQLLPWADLSAGALCAVLGVAAPTSTVGTRAWDELQTRQVPEPEAGIELMTFERPNTGDALARFALDRGDADRAYFGHLAVWSLYVGRLMEFVSRFYLIDLVPAFDFASDAITKTYAEWDYLGRLRFEADLLRRTLGRMPRFHPQAMPPVEPAWLASAAAEEKTFLRRTLILDRVERLVLFLTVYAAMTPWEIAPAVSVPGRPYAPKQMEILLKRAWQKAFAVL